MRAVLLAGAHGHQEAGIALEDEADLVRNQSLEMARRPHVLIAGCVAAVAAAEWLQHGGGAGWAGAAGAAALASAVAWGMRPPRGVAAGLATLVSVALGVVLVTGTLQMRRIECCWPEVRAGRIPRDSTDLKSVLAAAVAEARRLAERGMTAALLPRAGAFAQLAEAMQARGRAPGVERGVVILGADGDPLAWAGRHRFVPARDTAELRAVITPFYVSLEARRQTQASGTAVARCWSTPRPRRPTGKAR